MVKNPKINVTVNLVPHPNPARVINLIAEIVVKQLLRKEESA